MPDVEHQPTSAYFDTMARHARTHWWYVGRRDLVAATLARYRAPDGAVIDVGCGTGSNLAMLAAATSRSVLGTDLSAQALQHAEDGRGGGVRTAVALAEHLPVQDRSCGLLA